MEAANPRVTSVPVGVTSSRHFNYLLLVTLLEIKTAVANFFEKTVSELTINGQDMFLTAVNQVRRQAELKHDFEFQRKLVTVSVNGVTGGSLEAAVEYGTATAVAIKSVIEMGVFDDDANLRPVEWTTVAESLERQRGDDRWVNFESARADWEPSGLRGSGRFNFTGTQLYHFPKDSTNNYTVGLEVYAFSSSWAITPSYITIAGATNTAYNGDYIFIGYNPSLAGNLYLLSGNGVVTAKALWSNGGNWKITAAADIGTDSINQYSFSDPLNLAYPVNGSTWQNNGTFTGTVVNTNAYVENAYTVSDIWTTYAAEYLIWGCVCYLNVIFQKFVFRQEGSVTSPDKQRDLALEAFIDWDSARYEQNRRHYR